jgi:hypothetical protein
MSDPVVAESWDMSDEREFIENLLNQRFNFFLIFYSLVLLAALGAKADSHLRFIIWFGFFICILLAWTIWRAQQKVDAALTKHLFKSAHPAHTLNDEVKGPSARWVLGYLIPPLCTLTLLVGGILAQSGRLRVPSDAPSATISADAVRAIDSILTRAERTSARLDSAAERLNRIRR